tara:strand:- start:242 stop:406 length:165 start_codon:yes stop_codon:yes gene_type:complete
MAKREVIHVNLFGTTGTSSKVSKSSKSSKGKKGGRKPSLGSKGPVARPGKGGKP